MSGIGGALYLPVLFVPVPDRDPIFGRFCPKIPKFRLIVIQFDANVSNSDRLP